MTTQNTMHCRIFAGEGERLTLEWEGITSPQGIRNRLTRARCGGDRNARALVNPFQTQYGEMAAVDFESREFAPWGD